MKLSTRARYGLKALIDLGLHSANEAISLQSIAERQDISTSYLEQLMAMLKKAGLVKSSRGAYGGYQLGKPADEISVGEVLRVLEGSLEAAACPGIENDGTCHGSDVCVAKLVWKRINDSITSAVDTLMLGQLIEESRRVHEEKMGEIYIRISSMRSSFFCQETLARFWQFFVHRLQDFRFPLHRCICCLSIF